MAPTPTSSPSLAADLSARGLVHQATDPAFLARLAARANQGAGGTGAGAVTVYAGFDPTARSLHVGHLLQLCTLRRLQLGGLRPIALAGGGTGLIGDPRATSGERPLQSRDDIAANLVGIRKQLAQFVDFEGPEETRALLLDNAEWLSGLDLLEFLRDVGKHFTVNQMIAKEAVKARLERADQGISFTEFSYMLLQAYDYLRLHLDHGCTLQFGGSDQWGNITMGVELIRKRCQEEVHGFTTPLVLKADGTKFGKTESGSVWLDPSMTSPYELHQFFINTEDKVVGTYLRYFTFLSHDEIAALDDETAARPDRRQAQRTLAREVVAMVHGRDEVDRAEKAATALFSEDIADLDEATLLAVLAEAPSSTQSRQQLVAGQVTLTDALVAAGLSKSRGEARRDVAGGGVSVNNRRQDDPERVLTGGDLLHQQYVLLRKGKRQYHLVEVR